MGSLSGRRNTCSQSASSKTRHNEGLEAKTTRLHTTRTCPPSGVFEIHSGVPRWETRTEETNEPGCQKEMDTEPRSARAANTITGALGAVETGRSGISG